MKAWCDDANDFLLVQIWSCTYNMVDFHPVKEIISNVTFSLCSFTLRFCIFSQFISASGCLIYMWSSDSLLNSCSIFLGASLISGLK